MRDEKRIKPQRRATSEFATQPVSIVTSVDCLRRNEPVPRVTNDRSCARLDPNRIRPQRMFRCREEQVGKLDHQKADLYTLSFKYLVKRMQRQGQMS